MNIRQLKALCEIVDHDFHVTAAASATCRSQSNVTRQIQLLESELGTALFERRRNKLLHLTEAGKKLLLIARRIVIDAENMVRVAHDDEGRKQRSFTIATSNFLVRHVIPHAVQRCIKKHPLITLTLRLGTPAQCAAFVARGEAEIAVCATQQLSEEFAQIPCYRFQRWVVTPAKHPLLRVKPLTIAALAKYPLVTFDEAFAGQQVVNEAFSDRGLAPRIAMSAVDTDVSNTYVAMGLGIAINAGIGFDRKVNSSLRCIDARHLFKPIDVALVVRRSTYLRDCMRDFMNFFAPHIAVTTIEQALSGKRIDSYVLPEITDTLSQPVG